MYLLKLYAGCIDNNPVTNLHSTMYLLKRYRTLFEEIKKANLHSTMYLLKPATSSASPI